MDFPSSVPKDSEIFPQGIHGCAGAHCKFFRADQAEPAIGVHRGEVTCLLPPTNRIQNVPLRDKFLYHLITGELKTSICYRTVLGVAPKQGPIHFPKNEIVHNNKSITQEGQFFLVLHRCHVLLLRMNGMHLGLGAFQGMSYSSPTPLPIIRVSSLFHLGERITSRGKFTPMLIPLPTPPHPSLHARIPCVQHDAPSTGNKSFSTFSIPNCKALRHWWALDDGDLPCFHSFYKAWSPHFLP